jgi:serine/threonine protein kinase
VGTLAYMAPEQLLGEPISAAADLWALGVTLYEMTTGRRPFQGEYEPAVMYEILNEEPKPARSINPELPAGLDRLLARRCWRRASVAASVIRRRAARRSCRRLSAARRSPSDDPGRSTFPGR